MFKNLSPGKLTLYIAILVTAFNIVIQFFFSIVNKTDFNTGILISSSIASFAICYLVVRFFISQYLIKKIRLIYKIIQTSKLGKSTEVSPAFKISGNVWENVEGDIANWANMTESEIENLKKLEQYRKDFVGNISHELKTPIFSIQGYIHTLLDGGLEDNKVNKKFLTRAASNVERLITIVDDLETISKLEAGVNNLNIEIFDPKELVDEVIADLEVVAKPRNIKLKIIENGVNFLVKGDREKFRQVFTNLITNSIKYGKDGGETTVEFNDFDQYILFEINDDGIGIEEDHLSHLFDRFYRVDKSRSRDVGGSGLGLSIVKHIVEAHNQTINVRSTPELGSTFGFTIEKAKK